MSISSRTHSFLPYAGSVRPAGVATNTRVEECSPVFSIELFQRVHVVEEYGSSLITLTGMYLAENGRREGLGNDNTNT
ncbi:hypothetical protein L2E82_20724 [Cichorium intybus]|uniref:Uncharacterized protein n=1 Tax=Cichorium intybus TaxID=13427 RepID=A0ACB9DTQ4_CICIN|nr:hypothetical protein L2E82_20724 [Cichorium intybus]